MPQMHILVPLSVVKNCNANLLLADYVSNEIMLHQGAPANDNGSRLDLISRWCVGAQCLLLHWKQ